MRQRFAVVPTGYRPKEYQNIYKWCEEHDTTLITIATTEEAYEYAKGIVLLDTGELNISKWWNRGLEFAWDMGADIVAVFNDDAIPQSNWWEVIESNIGNNSGASGMNHNEAIMGWAFALQDKTIRADERIKWYFTDDVIQRRCEQANGFKLLKTVKSENTNARESEDRLVEQIEKDREAFRRYYA